MMKHLVWGLALCTLGLAACVAEPEPSPAGDSKSKAPAAGDKKTGTTQGDPSTGTAEGAQSQGQTQSPSPSPSASSDPGSGGSVSCEIYGSCKTSIICNEYGGAGLSDTQ